MQPQTRTCVPPPPLHHVVTGPYGLSSAPGCTDGCRSATPPWSNIRDHGHGAHPDCITGHLRGGPPLCVYGQEHRRRSALHGMARASILRYSLRTRHRWRSACLIVWTRRRRGTGSPSPPPPTTSGTPICQTCALGNSTATASLVLTPLCRATASTPTRWCST